MRSKSFQSFILAMTVALLFLKGARLAVDGLGNVLSREIARSFVRGQSLEPARTVRFQQGR